MSETMTPELRPPEVAVLKSAIKYVRKNGISPSRKDLMIALKNPSESMLNRHLTVLRDSGYLTWVPQTPRSIRILRGPDGQPFTT